MPDKCMYIHAYILIAQVLRHSHNYDTVTLYIYTFTWFRPTTILIIHRTGNRKMVQCLMNNQQRVLPYGRLDTGRRNKYFPLRMNTAQLLHVHVYINVYNIHVEYLHSHRTECIFLQIDCVLCRLLEAIAIKPLYMF